MIATFDYGMAGPFNDSLIRNPTKTFSEVRERVVAYIEAEEFRLWKNASSHSRQLKPKESGRDQPLRVHETSAEKKMDLTYVLYVSKKDESRGKAREEPQARPKFHVFYKKLLGMLGVVDKLKFSQRRNGT